MQHIVTWLVVTVPIGWPPDAGHAVLPAPHVHAVQLRLSDVMVANDSFVAYDPAGHATSPA